MERLGFEVGKGVRFSRAYWEGVEELVGRSQVVIDRPVGSRHPRYPEMIYPIDYGYLEGTTAGDGDGIDIWVGSQVEGEINGVILTVDLLKKDMEVKLLKGCTEEEIETILTFLNNGAQFKAIAIQRKLEP